MTAKDGHSGQANFMSTSMVPGENEKSETKKANLGVMLGVYLPTIQHILGVTMFIRLAWVVGIAGIVDTMILLLLCCLCTLLTSISLSAVATNGIVESGGVYFMISRNLGPEFGSAVGILFYLANTVASSMYLIGGIEVMLLYIFPSLTIGGNNVHSDTDMWGMMSHNYRIYGSALLLLEVIIVAMGVRFVQLLAPVSLFVVITSILACFAGGVEKMILHNGQHVCMLNEQLLQSRIFFPHGADLSTLCNRCVKSEDISDDFCNSTSASFCTHFTASTLTCSNAFPGINAQTFYASSVDNSKRMYMEAGESYPNVAADDTGLEVSQDFRTSFFILLAIYFPAVTGIMTGTNMSGDLKDPQKSIPLGTIAATLTTSAIYYALALLFGASITGPVLRDKYGRSLDSSMIVALLSWPSPWVVIIGSFLSTFGAALQCLCSAPRLLQSIAKDDVIPVLRPFSRVTSNNEPFLGLLITACIAEFAILLGAVDKIAEVLDFFFLMCYAFVNLICALHSLLKVPNWRPRFRYYHWSLSLAGATLCFFIMFASHWQYAVLSINLTFVIYKAKKEWGDGIRGLALSTAQYSLLKIEDKDPHPKNWRPQLLVLIYGTWSSGIIDKRYVNLINLAGQLKAGRGLAIVVALIKGSVSSPDDRRKAEEVKERIRQDMLQVPLRGFGKTLLFDENQSVGIGALKPNTVLMNWPEKLEENTIFAGTNILKKEIFDLFAFIVLFCEMEQKKEGIVGAIANDECIMLTKGIAAFPSSFSCRLTGHIDIWWILNDGDLLMLTAFLLKQHKVWRGCKLRIFATAEVPGKNDELKAILQKYIYMLRIDAAVFIVDVNVSQKDMPKSSSGDTYSTAALMISIKEGKIECKSKKPTKGAIGGKNEVKMETTFSRNGFSFFMDRLSTYSQIENDFHEDENWKTCLETIKHFNDVIVKNSSNSQLVLLSLPRPPTSKEKVLSHYMQYIDTLTLNLQRILFIGGSGKEVVTVNS
uniref:Solute carrier family 12 member 6 n=1 Tax=Setaria digitata TaxID=48799 RepID=A0A915Q6S8_9BILA